MIPLIMFPVAVFVAATVFGTRSFARQRPSTSSIVPLAVGLITLGIVATLAYWQGIVADETASSPPSGTPLLGAALGGLVLVAMGAVAALRRPGSH